MDTETHNPTVVSFLSKQDTLVLKGVAILLMLEHHLWGFPERIPVQLHSMVGLADSSFLSVIGDFGRICIAVFAFLGGYGKFKKYADKPVKLFDEIKNLYARYWQIFIIFVPIGFAFFNSQSPYCHEKAVYACFSVFSLKELLLNFFGLLSTYNREWWFLATYLICIILFPLIRIIVNKLSLLMNVILVLLFEFLFLLLDLSGLFINNRIYFNLIGLKSPFIACFWFGCFFAKYEFFSKFDLKIKTLKAKPLLCILSILSIFVLRELINNLALEFLFVVVFVFCCKILLENRVVLNKPFAFLGKHSTNIWLVHTFFCYYFGVIAKTVVSLQWAVPSLLLLLVYSVVASVLITYFWDFLRKGVKKLFGKKIEHNYQK